MRRIALIALMCLAAPALAADEKAGRPKDLQPIPEPPPPPAGMQDDAGEPQVTIKKQEGGTVEEYRANGRLYMIKVTPAHGHPYYLIDQRGDGQFTRQDNLDSGVRVPQWVLFQF